MQAIEVLREAAEAADADRVEEARSKLRAVLRAVGDVASAPAAEVDRLLLVCGGAHGLGSLVLKLKAAIKEERASNVVAFPGGSDIMPERLSSVSDGLDGCPDVPADLPIPEGYAVTEEGRVWARYFDGEEERYRPVGEGIMAVIGRAWDVETGAARVTLAWRYSGRWVALAVPRSTAMDGRKIMTLADHGAPINGKSAPVVASWLSAQEMAADRILPASAALSRMGWTPDMSGYLIGEQHIGARVVHTSVADGESMNARWVAQKGTLAGWVDGVWNPCRMHPMGLIILSAMVPPLLPIIGATGWTLDIGGETSTGKTSALQASASVWGVSGTLAPGGLVKSWPRTWAGLRGLLEFNSHIPTFFDDTQMVADKPELVRQGLYAAAFGGSQTMGQAGGGLRRERPISTVVISTGEVSVTSVCAAARGATTRLITVRDSPLPPGNSALADAIKEARIANHGVAGHAIVSWLDQNRHRWGELHERYRALQLRLQATAASATDGRVLVYVAQLQVAAWVAAAALGVEVPDALLDLAARYAADGSVERDTPTAALLWARSWWDARPGLQFGARDAREVIGWDVGSGRIGWAEGSLRKALTEGGYNPTEIFAAWRNRGWLVVGEPGRFSSRISSVVDPSRPRAVVWSDAAAKVVTESG